MLGLGRPRLKARPSLLDLISRRELELRPSTPSTPSPPPELPPLPDSPASTTTILSSTNCNSLSTPSTHTTTTMAPAKEQEPHGSIFSVSGPVVVAENMIGCAMYELVRDPGAPPNAPARHPMLMFWIVSAVSDTICSSVKLSESTETKPRFRFMRKPVRLPPLCGPRMLRSVNVDDKAN